MALWAIRRYQFVGTIFQNNRNGDGIGVTTTELADNVSLSLHNSFCLNRESKVKGLPNQAKRLQEQREWMRSYEKLKAWEEIVISSDDEEALLRQIAVSSVLGLAPRRRRTRDEEAAQWEILES